MDLLEFIKSYQPYDEVEAEEKEAFIQFLEAFGDKAYVRENLVGHFSSSCWIVNPSRDKVLMVFHSLFKTWSWAGGHADGDSDLLRVAVKEAQEETSLSRVRPVLSNPIDLNVMVVHNHYKRGKFVPRHLHYNAVYLLEADETASFQVKPDENSGVKWIRVENVANYCKNDLVLPYYERIMKKVKERKL